MAPRNENSTEGNALNNRIIPLSHLLVIFEAILSVLPPTATDLYVIAEAKGTEKYFSVLRLNFPNVKFFNGNERDAVERDLDHMANADVLIVGRGSFGALGASLNGNGILLLEGDHPKFDGWRVYRSQSILSWKAFDKKEFSECVMQNAGIQRKLRHYGLSLAQEMVQEESLADRMGLYGYLCGLFSGILGLFD